MSSIEHVIARARMGDDAGFSERRTFKLARSRAIEKMRKFALANPYFYILELIQAAVANDATWIDIGCEDGDVTFSYIGTGYVAEADLAQLFDFLFASKERLDLAHVRALALGINALLLYEPTRVIIESGDGTLEGTTRLVIKGGADHVDMGRADRALSGTFVRAERLDRKLVERKHGAAGDDWGSGEYGAVETRCIAGPVPIFFNQHPVFGTRKARIPGLMGYKHAIGFDEGDLYGILGLDPMGSEPIFKLLTFGVWIQSYSYPLMSRRALGGIVCFDRLHKTADHSGFVKDARFDEMWLRLRPHAERLVHGETKSQGIEHASGHRIEIGDLRELLADAGRVVTASPDLDRDSDSYRRAVEIARALEAELLRVPKSYLGALAAIAGDSEVVVPHLGDPAEHAFYMSEKVAPFEGPWLDPPRELDTKTVSQVAAALADGVTSSPGFAQRLEEAREDESEKALEAALAEMRSEITGWNERRLGRKGTIAVRVGLPLSSGDSPAGVSVHLYSLERELMSTVVPSTHAGARVEIRLPPTSPPRLHMTPPYSEESLLTLLLREWMPAVEAHLAERADRELDALGVGALDVKGRSGALGRSLLARFAVARLREARPGRLRPGLSFSMLRPVEGFDPLAVPMFATLDGRELSLREVALLSDDTGGLVYGVIPSVEADLEGLDRSRILDLDEPAERALVDLVGEAGYVRIDGRDVLARHGDWVCRDLAIGLRGYEERADFPLWVEGPPLPSEAPRRRELLATLVGQLREAAKGHGLAFAGGLSRADREENRRHAMRHLQAFVCRAQALGLAPLVDELGLRQLPIALDLRGRVHRFHEILESQGSIVVHHGHRLGASELGTLAEALDHDAFAETPELETLATSPFLFRLLMPLCDLRTAFDFDLDVAEAVAHPGTPKQPFLARREIAGAGFSGIVGVPASPEVRPSVPVFEAGGGVVSTLDTVACQWGLVGSIERVGPEVSDEAITEAVDELGEALLGEVLDEVPRMKDASLREAALTRLLDHAGHSLELYVNEGRVARRIWTKVALRIFELPLFPAGRRTLSSAHRLLDEFCGALERGEDPRRAVALESRAGAPLHEFVTRWFDPAGLHVPSSQPAAPAQLPRRAGAAEAVPWDVLAHTLATWIHVLRPDKPEVPMRLFIHAAGYVMGDEPFMRCEWNRIDLCGDHWLVEQCCASGGDPELLAWLLLAIYAELNARMPTFTDDHERQFVRVLMGVLEAGDLQLRTAGESKAS